MRRHISRAVDRRDFCRELGVSEELAAVLGDLLGPGNDLLFDQQLVGAINGLLQVLEDDCARVLGVAGEVLGH